MGISHAKRFDVDEILYQHCVKKLLGGYLCSLDENYLLMVLSRAT
jgi:hypothetical protein